MAAQLIYFSAQPFTIFCAAVMNFLRSYFFSLRNHFRSIPTAPIYFTAKYRTANCTIAPSAYLSASSSILKRSL
jgi:hypothetical protein